MVYGILSARDSTHPPIVLIRYNTGIATLRRVSVLTQHAALCACSAVANLLRVASCAMLRAMATQDQSMSGNATLLLASIDRSLKTIRTIAMVMFGATLLSAGLLAIAYLERLRIL
jgi:hypothetical protein